MRLSKLLPCWQASSTYVLVCKVAFTKITINHGHVASLHSLPCFRQLHLTKSFLIFLLASLPGGFLLWSYCLPVVTGLVLCHATICNSWVVTSLNISWQLKREIQTLDWHENKCNNVKKNIKSMTNHHEWEARVAGSHRIHEFL